MSAIFQRQLDLDVKRTEIQNSIDQWFTDFQQTESPIDDQKQRINRNILLLGLSKSGKTTLKRVLSDPRYIAEELSLRSSPNTKSSFESNIKPSTVPIILNIVELPEVIINTNDLSMINNECTHLGIHDFHMIGLCVSLDTGIDGTVIKLFKRFTKDIDPEQAKPNLCLIITRCESKDDNQIEKLRNEVMQDADFSKIIQYFGRGIHFSGALNRDHFNRADKRALDNQFRTVYEYRKNLLELIEEDIKPFRIQPPSLQTDARSLPPIIKKRQTDSLQEVSNSVERAPIQLSKRQQITTQEPISFPKYQTNRSLEQTTAETPLLPNRTPSKLSRIFSRLPPCCRRNNNHNEYS